MLPHRLKKLNGYETNETTDKVSDNFERIMDPTMRRLGSVLSGETAVHT
jgi:hypothetical protein